MKVFHLLITAALLLCFNVSGCMTVASQALTAGSYCADQGDYSNIYSGTVMDVRCITHYGCTPHGDCSYFQRGGTNNIELLCLIDVPLSFVLDTVILPYTVYRQATTGNICNKKTQKN